MLVMTVFMALLFGTALCENETPYTLIDGTRGNNTIEGPQGLLYGDVATKWCVKMSSECYIIFKTQEPVSIDGYILVKANDDASNVNRSPYQWELWGMNSSTVPKKNDKGWEKIDDHTDKEDKTMSINANWDSYAFILSQSAPQYEYYMLKIRNSLGDPYMQLSELKLITDRTIEYEIVATDNPEQAIVAKGELVYNNELFELVHSEDVFSDTIVLGGGLTPIKVSSSRKIRLKMKERIQTEPAGIYVDHLSAYDIGESKVDKLQFSRLRVVFR